MVDVSTWLRYMAARFGNAVCVTRKLHEKEKLKVSEQVHSIWKNLNHGSLTYFHWTKGKQMEPIIDSNGATLLVRKIARPTNKRIHIGDVIVHRDPMYLSDILVRRVVALEDWYMVSTDENEQFFMLCKDQCWALADNENLTLSEARDCRVLGPLYMPHILGRAIYCVRSAVDHGPIKNSHHSTSSDSAIIEMELDIDEMIKYHKAKTAQG